MAEKPDQIDSEASKKELTKVAEEQKIKDATRLQLDELLGETEAGKTSPSIPNAQNGIGTQSGGVESGSTMGHAQDESVQEKKEGEEKTELNKQNLTENPKAPQLPSSSMGSTLGTGVQTGGEISGTSSGAAGQSGGNIIEGVTPSSTFGF